MKKQVFLRGLLGFPLGISIGYIITIIISLGFGKGYYLPCVPSLIIVMKNQINAVMFQAILCGILGSCCAASSVVWEIENWSIAKQTGVYFFITSIIMMPIGYLNNWMEHSLIGFIVYFTIFIVIFMIVWLIQYIFFKKKIKKMNTKLK